jgi:hypothetical protein
VRHGQPQACNRSIPHNIVVFARLYQNSDKQGGGLADLIGAADLITFRGGMGRNRVDSATEMLQDIHIKLTDPASSDCTIVCNGKRFSSHKYILCLRSNVFKVQTLLMTTACLMANRHRQCRDSGNGDNLCSKIQQSGKDSVTEGQPLLLCM